MKREAAATEEWRRFTGRLHYAKVSLRAEPASTFELLSEPSAWIDDNWKQEFEPYVLEGVVSELLQHPGTPVLGIRVFITATTIDEVASNGNSFYMAAKAATERLLQGPAGEHRGNCE
ncbi:hypothetical protein HLB44_36505 [Aquincola sp. S2]|uniref:Translation elongation factor EFG/EF2 domain-containing protein n=1 Tax=Pseudaquabacterium terrae TaxID=2732868 RepID=A0ABX2EUY3_9BURK|nr:hypothetical protein [Aquabacterium terrae]NRF72466.1 hypothetical protein [Aquabacterium terrae]